MNKPKPNWKSFFVLLTISISIVLMIMGPTALDNYTDIKVTGIIMDSFTNPSYTNEDKGIVIFASGNDEKEILEDLREIYIVAYKIRRTESITVFIENKSNGKLIVSSVKSPEFRKVKWHKIKTYNEFKEKANIIQKNL